MNKILVAFDCSDEAKKALEHAIKIADPDQHIVILSVIPEPDSIVEQDSKPEITSDRINEQVNNYKEELNTKGIHYSIRIVHGDIIKKIVAASDDPEIKLVVLGYKGITNIGQFRLGSISGEVAKLAKKPVLVIK
jgi:nucleotide-binding universal stress UspA family protein